MENEQQLLSGLKEGNSTSFELLYKRWSGKLYNFVMKISRGDGYLAEELVQNVFVKVWETRALLDSDKSFASYICTIAKNMLTNIYQHRMQEYLYRDYADQQLPLHDNTTEKDIEYHLLEEYIDSLIQQLPPARREVFILSRRHFLSNKEIAAKLCLSENTVESQLTKAISFMRTKMMNHYNLIVLGSLYLLND